ncbi:MAG: hypothetical protein JW795_05555 [Chitinivibrionales bacterium]|nr:hypothetical protein [Chitinivibrionales bacterium]
MHDRGLCNTCLYGEKCLYSHDFSMPRNYCEQFQLMTEGQEKDMPLNHASKDTDIGEIAASDSIKGLCVNCENKQNCVMSKTEGGIWRCEEYR